MPAEREERTRRTERSPLMPSAFAESAADAALSRTSAVARSALALLPMLAVIVLGLASPIARAQPQAEPPPAEPASAGDADVEALIRVLEDDEARARLIERLRAEAAPE